MKFIVKEVHNIVRNTKENRLCIERADESIVIYPRLSERSEIIEYYYREARRAYSQII